MMTQCNTVVGVTVGPWALADRRGTPLIATAGTTERVSVGMGGVQADN